MLFSTLTYSVKLPVPGKLVTDFVHQDDEFVINDRRGNISSVDQSCRWIYEIYIAETSRKCIKASGVQVHHTYPHER